MSFLHFLILTLLPYLITDTSTDHHLQARLFQGLKEFLHTRQIFVTIKDFKKYISITDYKALIIFFAWFQTDFQLFFKLYLSRESKKVTFCAMLWHVCENFRQHVWRNGQRKMCWSADVDNSWWQIAGHCFSFSELLLPTFLSDREHEWPAANTRIHLLWMNRSPHCQTLQCTSLWGGRGGGVVLKLLNK